MRIDLLRGLAVLAMLIDHLAGPSRLHLITGGHRFYTSAAEGFMFLSGLTVGLVYRRIAERTWTLLRTRAIQVTSIGLIWLAIRFRVLYPGPEHRRRWMAAVVPLALAAFVTFSFDASPALAGQTIAAALPTFADGQGSASQYVGTIAGSFREVGFYSEALGRNMTYYLYLPPGSATDGHRYPVLYMLHGGGGGKDEWPSCGIVNDVDQLIVAKQINPLIVVMPQGDSSYWVNWANGGPKWGDYIAQDLLRHVDVHYPTLADPRHRAIGGLSMGGAGALQLTFNHPDIFGVVGAHSPALHLDDKTFTKVYGTGSEFAQREPINLAATAPNIGPPLKIWIDMGDADPWLGRDEMLHQNLLDRGIVHDWKLLTGGHTGEYWAANLPLYLHFYDSALNPSPST